MILFVCIRWRIKYLIFIILFYLLFPNKLFQSSPGPLHSQSQGNGGQLLDGVEPQLNVLISQLVYQDGYGVERVVPSIVRHRQRRSSSISESYNV